MIHLSKALVLHRDEQHRKVIQYFLKRVNVQCELAVEEKDFFKRAPDFELLLIEHSDSINQKLMLFSQENPSSSLLIIYPEKNFAQIDFEILNPANVHLLVVPYSLSNFASIVHSMISYQDMYLSLQTQKLNAESLHNELTIEHEFAQSIFEKIISRHMALYEGINIYMSPMSTFNGDLFLVENKPSGETLLLLGDFTGHGLRAAIGSLPVSSIFQAMVQKGHNLLTILKEINDRLKMYLPQTQFFSVALVFINPHDKYIEVANAGMHDVLIMQNKQIVKRIESFMPPLGILETSSLNLTLETIPYEGDEQIYIYTDGITETMNESGEMYGVERFEADLQNPDLKVRQIIANAMNFSADENQTDDVSLIEIDLSSLQVIDSHDDYQHDALTNWSCNFVAKADRLRDPSFVAYILDFIFQIQKMPSTKSAVYTLTQESFTNSLEHGLLKLDSSIKNKDFGRFFMLKEERLEKLTEGEISIGFEVKAETSHKGRLIISIEDSGEGFDVQAMLGRERSDTWTHGRGIPLISELSDHFEFNDKGNKLSFSIDLNYDD